MIEKCLIALLSAVTALSGCSTQAVSAESLQSMPAPTVCREIGFARYLGDSNAFALAQREAERRIATGAISAEECSTYTMNGYRRAPDLFSTQPISR